MSAPLVLFLCLFFVFLVYLCVHSSTTVGWLVVRIFERFYQSMQVSGNVVDMFCPGRVTIRRVMPCLYSQ